MELQKHQFWMLKEHSTINGSKEFEPDVLYWILSVRGGFKNSKFYKGTH